MALGAAIGRYRGAGFDSEVVVMLAVAGVLIALLLPMAVHGLIARFPRLAGPRVALAAVAVAVAVLAAGTAWFANLVDRVAGYCATTPVFNTGNVDIIRDRPPRRSTNSGSTSPRAPPPQSPYCDPETTARQAH